MGPAIALGVAQAALSIKGQRDAAKAQEQAQGRASAAEQKRLQQEMSATRISQAQERIAAAKRIQEASRASMEARATAVVSAGEAGIAGISVDALENDIMREKAEFIFGVKQQAEFNDVARHFSFENAQMASTMNQLRINKPIAAVDYAGAIMSGVQTGTNIESLTQ